MKIITKTAAIRFLRVMGATVAAALAQYLAANVASIPYADNPAVAAVLVAVFAAIDKAVREGMNQKKPRNRRKGDQNE